MFLPRLQAARERKALTQRELAALAHVAQGTIVRIEAGEDCQPRTARKLAEALGIEPADLMEPAPAMVEA